MAVLLRVVIVAVFVCYAQAYLTGESCRDYRGQFALRWRQCSSGCSPQSCRCVFAQGRLQADCERVSAVPIRVPYGCNLVNVQNATDINCCQIQCPEDPFGLAETCDTPFGQSFREGESWTQCSAGRSCCFESCQCVRRGGRLVADCPEACPKVLVRPGCRIVEPFQNSTFRDCCRIECQPEAQCESSFGERFAVGETWEECSPSRGCCTKSCTCQRTAEGVESRCLERCPGIVLPDGCRILDPVQNATHKDCCRTDCPVLEECTTSFGGRFLEGQSWDECSGGLGCCSKSCRCERQSGQLRPNCIERCPGIRLPPGCRLIEPFQNTTHRDCCRTDCSGTPYYGGQVQLP